MAIEWKYLDTSSQTVVWRTERVYHLKQDGHDVIETTYGYNADGTPRIVWEEYIGNYVTGTLPTGVASLTCRRVSKDPAISSGTITNNAYLYNNDTLTFTATASSYWTASVKTPTTTVTSIPPDSPLKREHTTKGVTTSGVTATRRMRKITVINNQAGTIKYTYTNASGTRTTDSVSVRTTTAGVSFMAWSGATVTYTVTPPTGYAVNPVSGTIPIGTSAATIKPTYTVASWKTYPDEYTGGQVDWVSTDWSNQKTTAVGIIGDANPTSYTKMRISGTITVKSADASVGTFSAVELSKTAYTSVTTVSVSMFDGLVSDTITLYVYGNDDLTAYCTNNGNINPAMTLKLTKLEVYS